MSPKRGGMFRRAVLASSWRGGRIHAGLAIGRSSLAFAARGDAESALAGQVLESPVEGAAIRLVAECMACTTTTECTEHGKRGWVS
jgi:hypothetical protein